MRCFVGGGSEITLLYINHVENLRLLLNHTICVFLFWFGCVFLIYRLIHCHHHRHHSFLKDLVVVLLHQPIFPSGSFNSPPPPIFPSHILYTVLEWLSKSTTGCGRLFDFCSRIWKTNCATLMWVLMKIKSIPLDLIWSTLHTNVPCMTIVLLSIENLNE